MLNPCLARCWDSEVALLTSQEGDRWACRCWKSTGSLRAYNSWNDNLDMLNYKRISLLFTLLTFVYLTKFEITSKVSSCQGLGGLVFMKFRDTFGYFIHKIIEWLCNTIYIYIYIRMIIYRCMARLKVSASTIKLSGACLHLHRLAPRGSLNWSKSDLKAFEGSQRNFLWEFFSKKILLIVMANAMKWKSRKPKDYGTRNTSRWCQKGQFLSKIGVDINLMV